MRPEVTVKSSLLLASFLSFFATAEALAAAPSAVAFFELATSDLARTSGFYEITFGWSCLRVSRDFASLMVGERVIGGLTRRDATFRGGGTTIFFTVDDLPLTLGRAKGLGAGILLEPMPVPGNEVQTMAIFEDPDGNPIGLLTH